MVESKKKKCKSCIKDKEGKRYYRKFLMGFLALGISGILLCQLFFVHRSIPSSIQIRQGEEEQFDFHVPCMATISSQKVNLAKSFTLSGSSDTNYEMKVSLFGIIPLKKVSVKTVEEEKIIPGGEPVGVYVETDGVMVLGTTSVKTFLGETVEPAKNIVVSGDYITAVNGNAIHYKSQFLDFLKKNKEEDFVLTLRRNDTEIKVRLQPVKTASGEYKCGIWIRDDTQGIGTLTYVKEDGSFGALGHGVSDVDTGKLLESKQGKIYQSKIAYVIPSGSGEPGELVGSIDYASCYQLGNISKNTQCGIFGKGSNTLSDYIKGEAMPIGLKQEIRLGQAQLISSISGEKKTYTIEIEKINLSDNGNKGMVIRVKDKELLSLTGGIVQGMSGSPIIQDGKVIGAVTHVFVNTPEKGYAAFIENMLGQ